MEASLIVTNPRVGYRRLEGEQKMVNNYCFRIIQFNDANLMYFYWFLMAILDLLDLYLFDHEITSLNHMGYHEIEPWFHMVVLRQCWHSLNWSVVLGEPLGGSNIGEKIEKLGLSLFTTAQHGRT